ncbi:MAG: HAD-IIB family hydrolase [bacterium]
MNSPKYIIFTDLDGTLLDHHTYKFDAALPALKEIKRQKIPLILTSSKTSAEIKILRSQIQNVDPFIVENGGAIFIPKKYFFNPFNFDKKKENYYIIEIGTPYSKLRQAFNEIKKASGLALVGFGDLNVEELVLKTDLASVDADLALQREYDEPFFAEKSLGEVELTRLKKLVTNLGLNITVGGRFYHLTGKNDKGKAVTILASIFKKERGNQIKTVGLGDSLNDLPMLEVVDEPMLVQKPTKEYDEGVLAKIKPTLAKEAGPVGWNDVVLNLLGA